MTNSSPNEPAAKPSPRGYKKVLKWIGIGLGALVLLVILSAVGFVGLIILAERPCENAAIPFDRQVWLSQSQDKLHDNIDEQRKWIIEDYSGNNE